MDLLDQLELSKDAFAGRIAIVTGGARGIGEQVARALAHLGAHTIILDKLDKGEATAAQIRGNDRSAEFMKVDLTDLDVLERVVQDVLEAHGRVDVLVNNASKLEMERFENTPIAYWDELHQTTVRASAFLISKLLPGMLENDFGVICNTMAAEGFAYSGPFSSAMVGQRSMILTLAGEVGAEKNVSVMGFAPGATDTPLVAGLADGYEKFHGITLSHWVDNVLNNPGYDGLMPAEHSGASYAYCLAHAKEYHGQIADAFHPLIRHGIIELDQAKHKGETSAEKDALAPVNVTNEYIWKISSVNRNLEQRIDERTKELEAANQDLASQKQLIEEMSSKISKYLPEQVYESIFSGEIDAEIASRRKHLTIFFSDIRDFTVRTDRLEPEALSAILNDYFTAMTEIAQFHGATIDKFIGDAMLAFFGDPKTDGPDRDAERCILMAIEMQRRMLKLEDAHAKLGLHQPLEIRIGINSGFCTVGNFGSRDRMDYTVIGSPVNVAARLQEMTEPNTILVSENTRSLTVGKFEFAPKGRLALKGIEEEIEAHQVQFELEAPLGKETVMDAQLASMGERLAGMDLESLGATEKQKLLDAMSRLLKS